MSKTHQVYRLQEYYLGDVQYPMWCCLRCGFRWEGRSPEPSVRCPHCKSQHWRYRPLNEWTGRRTKTLNRPQKGTLLRCAHIWIHDKFMEGGWLVEKCKLCGMRKGRPKDPALPNGPTPPEPLTEQGDD